MIGLDTWFFFQLKERNQKAIDFWKSIISGRRKAMISVLVFYELGSNMLKGGESDFYDKMKRLFLNTPNLHIIDVNFDISEKALKLSHTHNVPAVDSLIISSYLVNKCKVVVTGDKDIKKLAKKKVIKIKKLK